LDSLTNPKLPDPVAKQRELLLRQLNKQLKRLETYLQKVSSQLNACLAWEKMHHEGLLLQANMHQLKQGMDCIVLADWQQDNAPVTVQLEPRIALYKQIEKRFWKSKKLKTGIPSWEKIHTRTKEQIDNLQEKIGKISEAESIEQLESLAPPAKQVPKKTKEKRIALPYREYISSTGMAIWVGKSARANDLLTFTYARGLDWWLHVRDYPGSHVIIRVSKGSEPDQQTLAEAMQIAIGYSKGKTQGTVDICITQVKFVARAGKKSPGKVYLSKHRIVTAKFDAEAFKNINEVKATI
jgi:predicted ribosome quality control (RQC) complex YloA/Tae2 family protein